MVDAQSGGVAAEAPPACNTGAQTPLSADTALGQVVALIDWLSITFPAIDSVDVVTNWIGGEWIDLQCGRYGYHSGRQSGNLQVWYGGQVGMGVHVQLSGKACRELEDNGRVNDWREFLRDAVNMGGRFSRCDVAMDEKSGLIDLTEVEWAIRRGEVVSRWSQGRRDEALDLHNGGVGGRSFYLGSPKSSTRLRIYDKACEQKVCGPWVRVELQTRDDRSSALVVQLIERGLSVIAPVLRGIVDFKVPSADSHKHRWPSRDWWCAFLSHVDKVRLVVEKVQQTLDGVRRWFRASLSPTLAMFLSYHDGCVDDFATELLSWADFGKKRWRSRHRNMVRELDNNWSAPELACERASQHEADVLALHSRVLDLFGSDMRERYGVIRVGRRWHVVDRQAGCHVGPSFLHEPDALSTLARYQCSGNS